MNTAELLVAACWSQDATAWGGCRNQGRSSVLGVGPAPALPLGRCISELLGLSVLVCIVGLLFSSPIDVGLDPLKETEKTEKKSHRTRNGILGNG